MARSVLARPVVPHVAARLALAALAALAGLSTPPPLDAAQPSAQSPDERRAEYFARFEANAGDVLETSPEHLLECVGGFAGPYPCEGVDLLEYLPIASIGGGNGNDVWGWTDPLNGKEYALMGRSNGTSFIDVTDPENPVYLGNLPTHTGSSTWRDIKTYANHAFIVSDNNGSHGMQVFDLTHLRSVPSPPATFSEDAWYAANGSHHNIVINEATGYAYLVGGSRSTGCLGGLHVVNIQNPTAPSFEGCFSADGYTHDAQCVIYDGPDTEHVGDEICFASNEDTVTIVEIGHGPFSATQLSRTPYAGAQYTHQCWLTEDHHYLLVDDELDEQFNGHSTYTYVWDVSNLEAPQLLGHFTSPTTAIDHNQYVRGNYTFQANYRSGLRILRFDDLSQAQLTQVGFFDTHPPDDITDFGGSWSTYPYFA
ncbi:MAG TPA: choice-of-anchor B family protein, partial [Thermoanaerobaculia bacterium]|nr:choice-of-anchor B family protein [Thermoanaerobaculia bacterium]